MQRKGEINRSRDLYVAFAFAAADLLVEVEADGTIGFAVGAAMAVAGRPARLLAGEHLEALFISADAPRIRRILGNIDRGERVRHAVFHAARTTGEPLAVALSGYSHPHRQGARLVAIAHSAALQIPDDALDPVTGVLDQQTFTELAKRILIEGANDLAEDAYRMTLLDVPQVEGLRAQGSEAADELLQNLGKQLRQHSLGGEAVGSLGQNRFGIIHDNSVSATDIEDAIGYLSKALGTDANASITSSTLMLDAGSADISQEEAANALLYTLNAFSHTGITLDGLSSEMRPRLSETVAQIRMVKSVIDAGEFELAFQPVVDLWTDVVHHFECLVRFPGQESPSETVSFAENVGIVGDLDLAVVSRAIEFARSDMGRHDALRFAVNLSGRSISNPPVARKLLHMMEEARDLRGRLLFELTESAEVTNLTAVNGVLQVLRRMGFQVCLDDFGAGHAAFHYLRALQVDHVKIDGAYVRDVTGADGAAPFLRAIAGLCADLKVGTIAEYVENAPTANLLKLLRVRFGQGYFFGKPMRPNLGHETPLKGWAGDGMYWQNGLLIARQNAPAPPKASQRV